MNVQSMQDARIQQAHKMQRNDNMIEITYKPKISEQTNYVYTTIIERREMFTDITGAFPVMFSKGNRYIFILYSYDQNAISSQLMKN